MSRYSSVKISEEQKHTFRVAKRSWENLANGEAQFKTAWATLMDSAMTSPLQKLALSALKVRFDAIPEAHQAVCKRYDFFEELMNHSEANLVNFSEKLKYNGISSESLYAVIQICSNVFRSSKEVLDEKDPVLKLALEAVKNELDLFEQKVRESTSLYHNYLNNLCLSKEEAFKNYEK